MDVNMEWPMAQRVTSPNKVPTWLTPNCVRKGPYPEGSTIPSLVEARYLAHVALGNRCVIQPKRNGSFIEYDYIGEGVNLEGPVLDPCFQWKGKNYRVLHRSNFPTVQAHKYDRLHEIVGDVLFHLACCYALGSGDVGLWNILVHPPTGKVVGVDMEDFRMNVPHEPVSLMQALFTRAPSKDQMPIYSTYLANNKQEFMNKLTAAVSNGLIIDVAKHYSRTLRVTPDVVHFRMNTLIHLVGEWTTDKHYFEPTKVLNPLKRTLAVKKVPVKRQKTSKETQTKEARPSMLTARSPCGHGFFDLASALQKCVRRGETETALNVLSDALAAGSPISTGIINRIRVIALEDVGIANFQLAISVVKLINDHKKPGLEATPDQLAGAVKAMCESKKTRILSLLFNAYCTEYGVERMGSTPLTLDDDLKNLVKGRDPRALALVHNRVNFACMADGRAFFGKLQGLHPQSIRELDEGYHQRKGSRDVRVFYLTPIVACMYVPGVEMVAPLALPPVPIPTVSALSLPGFTYDMHTTRGKSSNRREQFAREGCLLVNEWNPFGDEEVKTLKDTYLYVKQCTDEAKERCKLNKFV